MSVSQAKRKEIERAIRAKHCSYSCIAERCHVDIEEVRRIARPIQQQRSAERRERRAQHDLEQITKGAKYNRVPYDNQLLPKNKRRKTSLSATLIGMVIITCILIMIICITVGLFRWAFGA